MEAQKLRTVLVANRGEIACRVLRACRQRGLQTVAVYSDADQHALHVSLADTAICIGSASARDSYLNIDAILEAARKTDADAIHPGYGFLSENAAFAHACTEAGIVFIGPRAETIAHLGDKVEARRRMSAAGVPIVPGYQDGDFTPRRLENEARKIGFPILLKAAAGGGGKGMRIVHHPDELTSALESAKREAFKAFGDDRVFMERYIENPRHIEVQVFGDHQGHVVSLFDRECSIQRRHQKVVEESPSPALSDALRRDICDVAVRAARAVDYVNAGTVEFMLDPEGRFYFLEMNTRLQVEHPVTEMVTGIDLVSLQLDIAQGQPIPFQQGDIAQRGHAIEVRIYAEDPQAGFVPSTGRIALLREPHGPGIRVDSSLYQGLEIPVHYDPMLAKVIAWGATRPEAIARLIDALKDFILVGPTSNIDFLLDIIRHPSFRKGETYTSFIDRHLTPWTPKETLPSLDHIIAAAMTEMATIDNRSRHIPNATGEASSPWTTLKNWRHFQTSSGQR